MAEVLQEKPDPEGFHHLAELGKAIVIETYKLRCQIVNAMCLEFDDLRKGTCQTRKRICRARSMDN